MEPRRRSGPAGEARCRCWGGREQEGQTAIGLSLCMCARALRGRGPLAQAGGWESGVRRPLAPDLLVWALSGQAPLLWLRAEGVLSTMRCLLHDLQVAGRNHSSYLRNQRGCGLPPLGMCEQASPGAPVTSEVVKKKGTATKHHPCLVSHPWEHTHPAAATAKVSGQRPHMPDHCHFPGPCN